MVMKNTNLILFLVASLTGSMLYADPTITLSVTDQNKQPINHIKPGTVFQVNVNVTSSVRDRGDVTIDGLQQFSRIGSSSSSHVMMINGLLSMERTSQYTLRADRSGSFIIGPAKVAVAGQDLVSDTVQLLVDQSAPGQHSTSSRTHGNNSSHDNSQNNAQHALVEFIPDKKTAFERQPVDITLKLWLAPGVQCSQGLSLPEKGWQIKLLGEPKQSSQMRGSKQYQVVEQRLRLVPKNTGQINFPAVNVSCLVPLHTHRMFSIFGPRMQEQVFSSEPFTIDIKKLPPHSIPANAVGMFNQFSASIDRSQARVGEGLIYKLTLEGQTDNAEASNFDADLVTSPKLQLPDGLTSYASQQEVKQLSPHVWQKSFEFVVQGTRAGQFTIPAQQFVYFEPHTEQYYTLRTEPIRLRVDALTSKADKNAADDKSANPIKHETDQTSQSNIPMGQNNQIISYLSNLTWTLFIAFALLFLGVLVLLMYCLRKIRSWLLQRSTNAPHRRAFSQAYKELARLKKNKDVPGLLTLIKQLFANRAQVPVPTVTESWMHDYLKQRNMPGREINDWLREVEYLQRFAFYEHGIGDVQIFERVERWLHELEKWI